VEAKRPSKPWLPGIEKDRRKGEMFKPDQPIYSKKDDILGRSSFAEALGDAILSYKEKDSVVVGLFGKWGSGKTSVINMALEHIDTISENKEYKRPVIIKFNPWNFSEQNQLISQFFRQLSVSLKRVNYAGEIKDAGEKLETYSKFFEPLAFIPTIGPFAGLMSKVFKNVGRAAKSWGELKEADLDSIKKELNDLLDKQSHKIIIVIDDIDRLNNTEIRQIFQLIKSLGDFRNTIYLLAFDKYVVINALKKVQEGSGFDYLEKVVQVPFEVPLISKKEVEQLLFSQINDLIKDIPDEKWDETYFGNIYLSGLRHFFRNIRDVIRFINSLKFSFNLVKEELNVIDFIAISAIQVFIPEIYYGIRDNKDIFSGVFDSENEAAIKQAKERCDEIIGRTKKLPQEVIKDFLKRLFPKLESIYGDTNYGYDSLDTWRKEGRIVSPDNFELFFRLNIQRGEISIREIEEILSRAFIPESFCEELLKLKKDKKIISFLDRMEDYTESYIPKENIENIITVLMDIGDMLSEEEEEGYRLIIDTSMRIIRLFYQLSHRFSTYEERFRIFNNAIEKAERSLFTIVEEISIQGQQHGKYEADKKPKPKEKLTVNASQLEKLEKLALIKIENWAKGSRLFKHRNVVYILYRWKKWGDPNKVAEFVNQMIGNDDGLIDFIASFLSKGESRGLSDYVGRVQWRINFKLIKDFVDVKKIEPRIRKISSSTKFEELEEKKKIAIKAFLDSYDGKIEEPF